MKPRQIYCTKCRRVVMLLDNEKLPEICGAESQGYSTKGIIGPYTKYCDGEMKLVE